MPIFEYRCLECGREFEYFHRGAASEAHCPGCGQARLERLVSICGVSSEASKAANLSAAHKRAAGRRQEKQQAEHAQHHEHFGDSGH